MNRIEKDGKTFNGYVLAIRGNLEKDWRDDLKAGDILITKSGDLRVIREAWYFNDGTLGSVILAIRKCSWTRRPYTSYDRSALKSLKFKKAQVKFKPKKYDHEFDQYIKTRWERSVTDRSFTCFDAKNFA